MAGTYCIICGKEKPGLPVKNDFVLDTLRWLKKNVTRDVQGNKLVVCKEDYNTYQKNYNSYRSRQTIYLVLGVLLFLLYSFISFSLLHILFGLGVIAFLFLMSLLSYSPQLDVPDQNAKKDKHKQ